MAAVSKPLRQPGLIVYFSGLGTSALVLWLVHYLNASHQFNIMGWYVNGILPAGALGVGVLSGLGYAIASHYLQVKLTRGFVIGMLTTAVLDYIAAQYLTYTQILDQFHLSADRYTFLDYIRRICEGMAFKDEHSDKLGSPLGAWGYLFKLLEMGGYALGAMVPSATVLKMPYCQKCQKYLLPHRIGHLRSPDSWATVKRLGRKDRQAVLQRVAGALLERVRPLAASLAVTPLAETESAIAALEMAASNDAAARVVFTLKKCPTCDSHHVEIALFTYAVDKRPATSNVAKFDKTAPRDEGG